MLKKCLTFLIFLMLSISTFGQSVKQIPYMDGDDLLVNAIAIHVLGDTNSAGEQLHDIYELMEGGTYLFDATMDINNPLVLTAPKFDKRDENKKPPVVRMVSLQDGTPAAPWFFTANTNVTFENIFFGGHTTQDVWNAGNFLRPGKPDVTITVTNCFFDYMGWAIFANFSETGVSYIVDNVYVKNNQNPGDQYSPFLILNTVAADSVVIRNTTYFQSHGIFMQCRTDLNYLEIDHCTIANALKMPIFNEMLVDAKITNNVFYNTTAIGETPIEAGDKDRDGLEWSIVNVDTLLGNEEGASDSLANVTPAEDTRNILVKNNVWFHTPEVEQFWADSGYVAETFMNARTKAMFDNDAEWPGLEESNNEKIAVEFTNITDPEGISANTWMMDFMKAYRGGLGTDFWGFESDRQEWPAIHKVNAEWPMTEDLTHNITTVTDDGGMPIGDQYWYDDDGWIDPTTKVEDITVELPADYRLAQNYPNPFNPTTNINFSIPQNGMVKLAVYNVIGEKVAELVNEELNSGNYNYSFDARNISSGVYFYTLSVNNFVQTRKMVLIK